MAQRSPVPIGYMVPLSVDISQNKVPIVAGVDSFLGRRHLSVDDKRVSRKQITFRPSSCLSTSSSNGAVEVVVEGHNPVVIRHQSGERRKLCAGERGLVNYGDVIELIIGSYLFEYVKGDDGGKDTSPSCKDRVCLGKRIREDEKENIPRKGQIVDDEDFARSLQYEEECNQYASGISQSQSRVSQNNSEPIRHFKVSKDVSSLVFRLMRVKGVPSWANTSSVSIEDVIHGNVQVAILSNYMVDIDWLLSECPSLKKIPHVLVIHGESDSRVDYLKRMKPANWILHKPHLPISYGTHHSKAMILVYPKGVRIIVHTANLIYVDWNNKSQGLWMQDFPWKVQDRLSSKSTFETDLVDYLSVLKWPEFSANLPTIGNVSINSSFFKKFDYSSASVRLIASVPGYHTGPNLKRWGHMKLRTVLESCVFDKEFQSSPLVYQFSSLGSLDEKWLSELALSMSSGFIADKIPLGLGKPSIIWPTVEDVRCSLEGYAAGNAIPSPQKNVEKEFLKKYWARWKAAHTGRSCAMPHIKTYTRYNGQKLAWFLLTSSNLSKAAWGSLQKNNSQLMIRSYELGVLFLSSMTNYRTLGFSCTGSDHVEQVGLDLSAEEKEHKIRLTTLFSPSSELPDSSRKIVSLPIPYELPPPPYLAEDVPWSWDRRYIKKDVCGQVWPRQF